jgi:arylsulfatase A-like enzyme
MLRLFIVLSLLGGWLGAAEKRPNVLLIVSDDQAFTDYGFMGHPQVQTPALDKLAKESLLFRRGYATSSLCCPSLSALLTGKYPHQTKITGNEPPWKPKNQDDTKPGRERARYQDPDFLAECSRLNNFMAAHSRIPDELGKLGYLSLQTGKWWAGNFRTGGFTHGMSHGEQGKGGRHGDVGLEIGRKTMQPIYDFISEAKQKEKPWFVWYAPMLPHDPHTPPEDLLKKYLPLAPTIHVARYWAMVEFFDQTCGKLLTHLDEQGLAKDTLVIYVTDNGWIQNPDNTRPRADSKLSQYDTGTRTPIMLRWPGHIAPEDSPQLASLLDVAPTLYSVLGIKPSEALPGIDLLSKEAREARKEVFGECHLHNAVNIDEPSQNLLYRWVVTQDGWKYIAPHPTNVKAENKPGRGMGPELYQVNPDALETKNLLSEQAGKAAELKGKVDAWWSPAL